MPPLAANPFSAVWAVEVITDELEVALAETDRVIAQSSEGKLSGMSAAGESGLPYPGRICWSIDRTLLSFGLMSQSAEATGRAPMLARTDAVAMVAERWLAGFEQAP